MDVTVGLVSGALSSCYLRTENAAVICSISMEQKNETDPQVTVEFTNQDPGNIHASIRSAVESVLTVNSRCTRIRVALHAVRDGSDLFSCFINSFSVCVILSGLRVSDTICSATVYVGGDEVGMIHSEKMLPMHMVYTLSTGMISQIYFDGFLNLEVITKASKELMSACSERGDWIRSKIEEIVRNGNLGKTEPCVHC